MPLPSDLVGRATDSATRDLHARWTMAYAAGLGEELPCYYDTRRTADVLAHPMFPVCLEWPLVIAGRQLANDDRLAGDEIIRAVHATHDLHLHRPIRAGGAVTSRLTVAGIERRKPGAYETMRIDTVDGAGDRICTTWMGAVYRGVDVVGPDCPAADQPSPPEAIPPGVIPAFETEIALPATAAHVYSECSRIWNPIHTDAGVATALGLPGIILHGTATLALAVSRVIRFAAGDAPERVARIYARFGAMVPLPSTISLRVFSRSGPEIRFEVLAEGGGQAIRDGLVTLRDP